jgi:hypothetical protein
MKHRTLGAAEYLRRVVERVGTNTAVAKFLGFSDASRIGRVCAGQGRLSELNYIKLARWMGDDPLVVLRQAGYSEMAGLLNGTVAVERAEAELLRDKLQAVRALLDSVGEE